MSCNGLILTLATTLAIATMTEAAPRSKPAPVLTQAEQICEAYGQFAFARGMDRNHGFAMFHVLRLSRQYDAQQNAGATARRMHDAIIRDIYSPEGQQLSPIAHRQLTESLCMDTMDRQPVTTARDRY